MWSNYLDNVANCRNIKIFHKFEIKNKATLQCIDLVFVDRQKF